MPADGKGSTLSFIICIKIHFFQNEMQKHTHILYEEDKYNVFFALFIS